MNPVHFMLGVITGHNDKTIKEIFEIISSAFSETVFEELPKEVMYKCIMRLLMDAMIEMSGDHKFDGMDVEAVLKEFTDGKMDDNKVRLTKKA